MLKQYLDEGGDILVMLGEGGETKYDTNINFLLEEFGIMVNNGTVCVCVCVCVVNSITYIHITATCWLDKANFPPSK